MPVGSAIKSPAQYRLMAGVAHGMQPRKKFGKSIGPSVDVAKKLLNETSTSKRKKFANAVK